MNGIKNIKARGIRGRIKVDNNTKIRIKKPK
jgi:hypothetical protein